MGFCKRQTSTSPKIDSKLFKSINKISTRKPKNEKITVSVMRLRKALKKSLKRSKNTVRASLIRPKKARKAALMTPKKARNISLREKSLVNMILNQGMGIWF